MSTVPAIAALSVALLTTPPPPAGLHTTPSKVVLTWQYMLRHDLTSRQSVGTCGGCHMVIVPKKRRDLRGLVGIGYGTPVPLPATALLFGTALSGVAIAKRWRKG